MRNRSRWTMSRRFKLEWALRQHTAEIVPSGLNSASGKKCAGRSPGGEVLHAQGFVFAIRRARSS